MKTLRTFLRVLTFGWLGRVENKHRMKVLRCGLSEAAAEKRAESSARYLEACDRLESQAGHTVVDSEKLTELLKGLS